MRRLYSDMWSLRTDIVWQQAPIDFRDDRVYTTYRFYVKCLRIPVGPVCLLYFKIRAAGKGRGDCALSRLLCEESNSERVCRSRQMNRSSPQAFLVEHHDFVFLVTMTDLQQTSSVYVTTTRNLLPFPPPRKQQ